MLKLREGAARFYAGSSKIVVQAEKALQLGVAGVNISTAFRAASIGGKRVLIVAV